MHVFEELGDNSVQKKIELVSTYCDEKGMNRVQCLSSEAPEEFVDVQVSC